MLSPKVMSLLQNIENSASEMLRLEERAIQACERIRKELDYHFVAVQMIHPNTKIIRTIYGGDDAGSWYNLGAHPIDVSEELRDIQAHVALHQQPPLIEVVKGWHPHFDRFIYRKFHHARYLRAFVPLIVMRDAIGTFKEADPAWFAPEGPADLVVTSAVDARETILLQPRVGLKSYLIVGTIEAGYDCDRGPGDYAVDRQKALRLFAFACQEAMKLFRSTARQVLQVIAESARDISGADLVQFENRLDVWSGLPKDIAQMKVRRVRLPQTVGESELTALLLGFAGDLDARYASRLDQEETLELFLFLARAALKHASDSVRSASLVRQLANLHEIAIALANESESIDLLETISGHTVNLLAADVVVIHEFRNGRCTDSMVAGRTLRGSEPNSPLRRQPSSQLVRELEQRLVKPAVDVETLATLMEATVEEIRTEHLWSGAAAVLRANDHTFGVMLVAYRRQHNFSPEEAKTIQTVASTAAVAIRNCAVARTRRDHLKTLRTELAEVEELARTLVNEVRTDTTWSSEQSSLLKARLNGLASRAADYTNELV
jgi:GAF domain